MHDQRPDPDRLLDLVNHDRSVSTRGRLKVFFGASAGVGKTYAMLLEAHRLLLEGRDVVCGVVETHGREETARLLEGLPVIPPVTLMHRGISISHFNLEEALKRKPSLLLMDECAYSNPPGSRHPKRWQDIEELLNQGIDVFTTLNVQHLESINDMVAKLTGVLVRETVPDSMFDAADDVALVDIPSDELLRRLHDGKVYMAPGANTRAAEHFFKKSNLIALRELALRRTAERVDAENDVLSSAHGQPEAQLGQKILVCVGHDALSSRVIRHARRMATRAKANWYAVYVETGRHERLSDKARLAVDRHMRLAEKMGARIVHITGSNAAEEILNYARDHGFTRIVVGHKRSTAAWRLLRGALYKTLIERGTGLEITTVTDDDTPEVAYGSAWRHYIGKPSNYLFALAVLTLATLMGLPFRGRVDPDNLTMIYLTAIVIIAARSGIAPSIISSFISVAAFNFFYTEPIYTFSFIDPSYYYTFSVMLLTSLIVGSLAAKLSLQARQARKREEETHVMYALTRQLSSVRGMSAMSEAAITHIGEAFDVEVAVFWPAESGLQATPETTPLRELKEASVARWAFENHQGAGRQTDTLPSAKGCYFPLIAEHTALGVLGIMPKEEARQFSTAELSQMETFASLLASAFQRAHTAEAAEKTKVEVESEKLRNILLSSVSHDLRTPLASITGAASSALMLNVTLPPAAVELLTSIHTEAARLAKLVTNLLDVTSLEAGKITLNAQPYFISEVIGSALMRMQETRGERSLLVDMAGDLPLIVMDGLLIEQVLVNVLENAIRYTSADGTIILQAKVEGEYLRLTISDNGTGIKAGDEEKIFDKFYTSGHRMDGNAGLGLAICKGIIEAHGGHITARNGKDGGAVISFTLPGLEPMIAPEE